MQETVADELETAYKGRVWAPELRHIKSQRQGIKAARVEIQTFTGDAKVRLTPANQRNQCSSCHLVVAQHSMTRSHSANAGGSKNYCGVQSALAIPGSQIFTLS